MELVLNCFYRLVWLILSQVYCRFAYLKQRTNQFFILTHQFQTDYNFASMNKKSVSETDKKPNHIGVIYKLQSDQVTPALMKNWSELTIWCLSHKISYLTIYVGGSVEVTDSLREKLSLAIDDKYWQLNLPFETDSEKLLKRGIITVYDKEGQIALRVHLRGKNDSCQELDSVAHNVRLLGQSYQHELESSWWGRKNCTYDGEELYKVIHQQTYATGFPDPNLIVAPGNPLQLHGFPPLKLRIAEIAVNPFPDHLYSATFLEALSIYNATSQRDGK